MSSYTVYLSNGQRLLDLIPQRIDTSTTSLSLQGDSITPDFGQFNPTNLVHLLEHFANVTPPVNPIVGQIWYNTTLQVCSVWSGLSWNGISGATGPTGPTTTLVAETYVSQMLSHIEQLQNRVTALEAKIT